MLELRDEEWPIEFCLWVHTSYVEMIKFQKFLQISFHLKPTSSYVSKAVSSCVSKTLIIFLTEGTNFTKILGQGVENYLVG